MDVIQKKYPEQQIVEIVNILRFHDKEQGATPAKITPLILIYLVKLKIIVILIMLDIIF